MEKLLWITLALSITACTGSTTSTFLSHIPAETAITSETVVMALDEISKDINYIPLETNNESLVKEVKSFIFDKNNIYKMMLGGNALNSPVTVSLYAE